MTGAASADRRGTAPVATLSTGRVRGATLGGDGTAEVVRFLGIPYAQPPVGARRFALPLPPAPWEGERDGTAFGATSPQRPYPEATAALLSTVEIPGEDTLTVNVWAAADAADSPVVLWIHGGSLERGTAALPGYDGERFARNGIVFVSLNYRLGAEGFSVFDDAPADLGLHDVAAGLEWVHREIAAFGGSPARITLMGESAGGALVAALLSRPDSRPRIAGAIIQSGPLEAVTRERAARVTRQMAEVLGVEPTASAFRAHSPDELLDARARQSAGSTPLSGTPGYTLAVDSAALPASPHAALVDADVPILIGTNTEEYRLWLDPDALAAIRRVKAWAARLALRIPRRAVRGVRAAFPHASPGEVLGQLVTDRLLRAPATRLARARRADTFVYEFAWRSPVRALGAAHAVEIGFVFGDVTSPDAVALAGADAPASLADEMHGAWVAFIRDGAPGWPAYGAERWTRVFDEASETTRQRRADVVDAV
ncbi:carboxylesterase family protein [Microbacterium sp. W1N]|uniref:carboxylesterase/lipase family protein n=1 Tax=Microbacterium festucae TaxID=2977531 RepID=UPI0021C1546A|nr:carboxylesterase family protein [Microbacterium festucae]MCT9821218.1 carboxylesterase family protein [Microbacterium festucae]